MWLSELVHRCERRSHSGYGVRYRNVHEPIGLGGTPESQVGDSWTFPLKIAMRGFVAPCVTDSGPRPALQGASQSLGDDRMDSASVVTDAPTP